MVNIVRKISTVVLILVVCLVSIHAQFNVGIGRSDCTGPSAEIVFMGYAKMTQKGCGIHLRQWARAFIVDDGKTRAAYVTVDACMMPHGIKRAILAKLQESYNKTYIYDNVILSGTHTHSTPGGFMQDLMYDVPDFGFVSETFNALVNGITQAIVNAHNNMVETRIFINQGEILDANINRSPASYLRNPETERARYKYDTDKDIVQLKFVRSRDNVLIGAINWYAVHATSMNNTNCLVTSDNVGYASLLLEQSINNGSLPGQGLFVGAFASTNLGDVSPNLKGPKCIDTGEDCDFEKSTCNGDAKYCIAFGPGKDMVESTSIIAHRLFNKAQELITAENTEEVEGPVRFIHQFVDMPVQNATVRYPNETSGTVFACVPAMGYAFAGGTTDGPGDFDFTQGTLTGNPFWDQVRDLVFPPTPEDIACHAPKPILITTGRIDFPYEWQPRIVSTQLLTIGQVVLAAVPGEFTTMSGRRLRDNLVTTIIMSGGFLKTRVIITGLSNVYTSYIATPEEYTLQRYEGASTIFGPHTLDIYIELYNNLATALWRRLPVDSGPTPPDFTSQLIGLSSPVFFDTAEVGQEFGNCVQQPPLEVERNSTVQVVFISGHPRNDVMQGSTFLTVEKLNEDDKWVVVATDASWETRFLWKRLDVFAATSKVTIEWDVGAEVTPGTYRINHFGHSKSIMGGVITPYQGTSDSFEVK